MALTNERHGAAEGDEEQLDAGGLAVSGPLEPPSGFLWLLAEPEEGLVLGAEVEIWRGDWIIDARAALIQRTGMWLRAALVKVEEAVQWTDDRRALLNGAVARGKETPTKADADSGGEVSKVLAVDEVPAAATEEDCRTLWVTYDSQGERFKGWKEVCQESSSQMYPNTPLEGPGGTLLYWMKRVERHGGDPMRWLELWSGENNVDESDRVYHELKVHCEVLWYGGTYDQLNMGALVAFERIGRRVQTIMEAYKSGNGKAPNWAMSKHFEGVSSAGDAISPALRNYGLRKAKDEAEMDNARAKKGNSVGPNDTAEAGGAAASNGGGKAPKGGKNNGGRGLPPAGPG
jgi:hypothetical protein